MQDSWHPHEQEYDTLMKIHITTNICNADAVCFLDETS